MNPKAVKFEQGIIGRFVWGSLYKAVTKDFDGKPLTIKTPGPDFGKPTQRYEFGLAVPKTQAHFASEPGWGQLVWATAHAAFPGNAVLMEPLDRAAFSWKITDGDSIVIPPKSKTKVRPCDRQGFKGHWVIKFSSSFAPKIYSALDLNNTVLLEGVDAIVPGYVIQVLGSVAGNTGNSPGIYINHNAIALRAYLPQIQTSGAVDTSKFAGAVNIAGASTLPQGNATLPGAPPAAPGPSPGVPAPMAYVPPAAPVAPPAAAPTAVVPAPGIVGIPAPISAPPAPGPALVVHQHKGHPVTAWTAGGWSMEQLRADGYVGP